MSNDIVNYLRSQVIEYHRTAAQNQKTVADLEERATRYRDLAAKHTAEANYWQRLLDFLELCDASADFADAFAKAMRDQQAARTEAERDGREETLAEQLRAVGAERAAQDAEAADVRSIQHDMDLEAGDEHDPGTCPECEA